MKLKNKIGNLIEIDWTNDLHELQPDNVKVPINLEYLKESIVKHGFALPFAVWNDGGQYFCVDGHTRKQVLTELQSEGVEVPPKLKAFEILAEDRTEAIKILVEVYNQKHNPFAEEILTEWLEVEEINIEEISLEIVNIMQEEGENPYTEQEEGENPYTDKIKAPHYEPSEEMPNIQEVYDTSKTDELIDKINEKKNLPKEVKHFLCLAAQRHTVFNYSKIADFYAHADKDTQELMEQSALVIIDYDKAIENGFIKLTKELTEQYKKEYCDDEE